MTAAWATGTAVAALAAILLFSPGAHAAAPVVESRPIDARGLPASQGGGAPGSLEERVSRLERQADNPVLLEMLGRLDAMQREIQELRGAIEMQEHKLGGIEQRQRDLYIDSDRRLRQLESKAAAESSATRQQGALPPTPSAQSPEVALPAATGATAAGAVATAREPDQPDAERLAYQRAFDDLQAGRYEASVAAFRNFLARYPDGQYSANAQYWLGEAKYVNRQFADAIAEFNKVLDHYPNSGKTADALLKLGFSHFELQEWDKAGAVLNRVVTEYPSSTARQLAENRLHRMRVEGR